MAEAHESVTEVDDDNGNEKGRRRRFGRRKESPKEVRSETEWVDTLVAHDEGEDEPLAGSPLAAGEDETSAEEAPTLPEFPETEPTGELPEGATELDDEVLIRERQLARPDKLSLENQVRSGHRHKGERDAFYEKSWNRRQSETHEDIRNFIDNVLGTESDPSRRRERLGRAGIRPRASQQTDAVHVEGLEGDIMIAFTFPREEFRSARVVYETEGGYVVEVTRAVGNDEARLETQYYTVSRVGEVGHVLDKMRAREAERRAREEGVAPVAPVAGPEPGTETEPLPEPEQEPPSVEDIGAPGADRPDHHVEDAAEPADEAENAEDADDADADASGGKKKGFGLFKRKKGTDDTETEEAASESDLPEPGAAADADAEAPGPDAPTEEGSAGPEDGGKKKGFGLFKRKKGDDEEPPQEGEGTTESENQA